MSLLLPPPGSSLRELFDVSMLVRWNSLPTFPEARKSARSTFAGSLLRVHSVNLLCIRASGEVELVNFGPKGGHRTLWNFGNPLRS